MFKKHFLLPTFGWLGLEPGKCYYINPNDLPFPNEIDTTNMRREIRDVFDLSARSFREVLAMNELPLFDMHKKLLVPWLHKNVINYVRSTYDDLEDPMATKIRLKNDDLNENTIKDVYANGLFAILDSFSTKPEISQIYQLRVYVYYLISTFTIEMAMNIGARKTEIYFKYAIYELITKRFPCGTFIGQKMVDAVMTEPVQKRLDAHKKPEESLNIKEMQPYIGKPIEPDSGHMFLAFKDDDNISDFRVLQIAKSLIGTTIGELELLKGPFLAYEMPGIVEAYNIYNEDGTVYIPFYYSWVMEFSGKSLAKKDINALDFLQAASTSLEMNRILVLPVERTINDGLVVAFMFDKNEQESVALEKIRNTLVTGFRHIWDVSVTKKAIITEGINYSIFAHIKEIDPDMSICDDPHLNTSIFGPENAIVPMTMALKTVCPNVDTSYLNCMNSLRAMNNYPSPFTQSGASKVQLNAPIKTGMSGRVFDNMNMHGFNITSTDISSSLFESTLFGIMPKIGSNYGEVVQIA